MKHKTPFLKSLALVTAVATGLFFIQPQPVRAGDSEWATAGKILTGVVAAHVLTNGIPAHTRHREVTVHTTRVIRQPRHHVRHSVSRRRLHRIRRPRVLEYHHYETRYSENSDCRRRRNHWDRGSVIHRVGPNKRLYQPRVHGHPAFVQKRPFQGHPWITVKKHPSVW